MDKFSNKIDKLTSVIEKRISKFSSFEEQSNLKKFAEELLNLNLSKVAIFSEKETKMIRYKFGIFTDGDVVSLKNLSLIFDISEYNIKRKFVEFYNRISLFIQFGYKKDNTFKLSSLPSNSKYKDFSLLFIEDYYNLFIRAFKNNIFTIYDLLSYSIYELQKMRVIIPSNYDLIMDSIHGLGLKFIDELSIEERKNILIDNLHNNTLDYSSLYFLPFDKKFASFFKKHNINTIGELKKYIEHDLDVPVEIKNICFKMGIIDYNKFNGENIVIKESFLSLIYDSYICFNDEMLNNFNILFDEVLNLSNSNISVLNDKETLFLRYTLGLIDNKTDLYDIEYNNMISKLRYSIEYGLPIDKRNRISSLSLYEGFDNFYVGNLDISLANIMFLHKNNIITLFDLLAYTTNSLRHLNRLSNIHCKEIIDAVHKLNLLFLDELSEEQKMMLVSLAGYDSIDNSDIGLIYNYSGFTKDYPIIFDLNNFIDYDMYFKDNTIGELRRYYLSGGRLLSNVVNYAKSIGIDLEYKLKDISNHDLKVLHLSNEAIKYLILADIKLIDELVNKTLFELMTIVGKRIDIYNEILLAVHNTGLYFIDELYFTDNNSNDRYMKLIKNI